MTTIRTVLIYAGIIACTTALILLTIGFVMMYANDDSDGGAQVAFVGVYISSAVLIIQFIYFSARKLSKYQFSNKAKIMGRYGFNNNRVSPMPVTPSYDRNASLPDHTQERNALQ
jgi:hypothetical protein